MEGHEEMEHMICHKSTEVQDVMCQQQSGDPEHMTEIEALLADWLRKDRQRRRDRQKRRKDRQCNR